MLTHSTTNTTIKLEQRLFPVARVDEIPEGWSLRVMLGARALAIANSEGTFHALDGMCSHAGGPLGDGRLREGALVECSWHCSTFDVRDGSACTGPARSPQTTYDVTVEDGVIYVALDGTTGGS